MKKIKTTDITTAVGMPLKSGSLEHLQAAYYEGFEALARRILPTYSTTGVYVLYGCENSGAGSTFNISAGAVFYNGEIYLVPATTFTTAGANVAVANIVTSYFSATNADPVQFTDSSNKNVHEIRQIVISSGASGSGIANYSSFTFNYNGWQFVTNPALATITVGSGSVTKCITTYRKNGNIVHLNYKIELLSSWTPASGQWSANITLPVACALGFVPSTDGLYGVCYGGTSVAVVGVASIDNFTGANIVRLLFTTTATGVSIIVGEITYPCLI